MISCINRFDINIAIIGAIIERNVRNIEYSLFENICEYMRR